MHHLNTNMASRNTKLSDKIGNEVSQIGLGDSDLGYYDNSVQFNSIKVSSGNRNNNTNPQISTKSKLN